MSLTTVSNDRYIGNELEIARRPAVCDERRGIERPRKRKSASAVRNGGAHPKQAYETMVTQTGQFAARDNRTSLLDMDGQLEALDEIGAADHLAAILMAAPEHLQANRKLAELLAELGDTNGAIRCWRRIVTATEEQDTDAMMLLSIALCTSGQYESAIELLTKLNGRHPSDATSLATLGMALFSAGRDQEALAMLMRAVALDSQSARAHCGLGLIHYQHQRWNEAAASFRATERLAQESAVGAFNLGLTLERLGERAEARRALLRAAALEPRDEEIQKALDPLLVRTARSPLVAGKPEAAAAIQGDLDSFDLLDVLEFLRLQGKTGSLVVSAPAGVAMLRMERGMLIGGSAPRLKRLGQVLIRRGLITTQQLASARSRESQLDSGSNGGAEPDAVTLAAALLRQRSVEERQLTDVLFRMTVHIINQINQWREGVFAFHPSPDTGFPIRLNVQEIAMHLVRLEDERRQRTEHP